jgi:hypothetical protein
MRSLRYLTAALSVTLALGTPGATVAFGAPRAKALERPTVVRVDDRAGFDWADAGIGAAGGVALSVLGVGVVLLVSTRKEKSCVQ